MRTQGFSLVELITSLLIAGMLMVSMQSLIQQASALKVANAEDNQTQQALHFAPARIQRHAAHSDLLMLPANDRPSTGSITENIRHQTVPSSGNGTAVLALALPVSIDRDGNGIADADNDGDGRINEDTSGDINNDNANGFYQIDDDGDGNVDENFFGITRDDDEMLLVSDEDAKNDIDDDNDGTVDEDWEADQNNDNQPGIAGVDDDGDGSIDEGSSNDDDEDSASDEDWLDYVTFFVRDSQIIERVSVPWDENSNSTVDGRNFLEAPLIDNLASFTVTRVANVTTDLPLLDVAIAITDSTGAVHSLSMRIRVGSAA